MSLATRFDLVIFDWAGTMVDFGCRAPVNALLEAFGRRGVALTEQEVRRDMGKAKADHVRALLDNAQTCRCLESRQRIGADGSGLRRTDRRARSADA